MSEQLFHKAVHMVDAVVRQVKDDDFAKPTPCSEWDVKALANHIISEVAWVEPLLAGKTVVDVDTELDGDLVGQDLQKSWHQYCKSAADAASTTDSEATAHLSYADKTVGDYLNEVGGDMVIHGWDLARAIGCTYIIDNETAGQVEAGTMDIMEMSRSGGYVAAAKEVDSGASASDKLIAYFGRDVNWSI